MTAERFLEDIYPLTPMQRGMLFHSLHAPGSTGMYVQQIEIRFRGALDTFRLKAAWETVIARHAALRTMFIWDEKRSPVQAVCRRFVLPWQEENWARYSDVEERLSTFLQQDRARGFDLGSGPPFRCALFITAQGAVLIWTFHHLAIDGWSMSIVLKDLLTHYTAARDGRGVSLSEPPSFRDYVVWLRSQSQDAALDFWKSELAEFPGNLPLPIEVKTGELEEYAEHDILLSGEATVRLEQMARRERVTLNACVQAAWALLLARCCGSQEVTFGVTNAGRPAALPQSDIMVGMFLNTVPVRVRIRPEDTIRDLLRRIFVGQVSREEHSWISLADIERGAGKAGADLFDSLLVFENYPIPAVSMPPELTLESVRGYDRTNYPLTVLAMPGPQLTLRLAWQTNRYRRPAIARLLEQFRSLLEGMPNALDLCPRQAPMLSEKERQELVTWNATQCDFGSACTLVDLLDAQAIATPDATAVSFAGESLTYRQLHGRADLLAGHLAEIGAGPETLLAVEMERSIDLIVALLAIVKCGAAWLPLDVSDPLSRRQQVARDAGALAVLVPSKRDGHACERVVALDSVPSSRIRADVRRPLPANLAYVICTSGSTGTPKGVMNTHEGLVNRLLWMQKGFQLTPEDVVLQKTPATFDVSVWEFFWPLITGARLAVAAPDSHKDPDALARKIEHERVTTMHFVPSMLRAFVEYAEGNFPSLKRVICSGEALPTDLVEKFHARFRTAELHNLYGPTEASIDVTHHACARGEAITPIGLPIANCQTWVLDERMAPQPVGASGELYLGGIQLARGYIGNPAITAERFVPDPFHPGTGARLYRTGDRARLLPNGEIAYLGRIDFQVKIRGFRVEPGEIEAKLESHPAVGQATVICFAGPEGNRLAAYVVPRNGVQPYAADLRAHLRRSLPEYMIPSVFTILESLPHTSSGKTDRKALAAAHRQQALHEEVAAGNGSSPSRNAIECEVRTIWEETLQTSGIGLRDNFFDAGGNSLLLVPIHRKLVARFGTQLSVPDLFRFPTIESLSAALSSPAEMAPQTAAHVRSANGLEMQRALRRQARGA